jgi:hypothetical protein
LGNLIDDLCFGCLSDIFNYLLDLFGPFVADVGK